jgi:hypothetical protein
MLTRRCSRRRLELLHRQPNNEPLETIMKARIGELFDTIITAAMGLASMSVVVAMAAGA